LRREAVQFAGTVEVAKAAGTLVDPRLSQVTVGWWMGQWLAGKVNVTEATRVRYEEAIRTHIEPRWGRVKLARIGHEDVQAWVAELSRDHAPASVRKIHLCLSEALEFAVKSGRIAANPAKGVSLPRVQQAEKRFLSHEQVQLLAREVGPSWSLIVRFLAYTGLRFSEVAGLRVRDVDLLRRRAIVARSVTEVRGKLVFSDTKGHERREVPVPRFLVDELYALLGDRDRDDPLFTGRQGGVLRAGRCRLAMARASQAMGVDQPLTPHELRHTAASLAIAAGADVKVIQTMLGHKDAAMTLNVYGHLFPDRLDVVSDAMERAREEELANPVTFLLP